MENDSGIGRREWIIAILASLVILLLCVVTAFFAYRWYAGDRDAEANLAGGKSAQPENLQANEQNAPEDAEDEPGSGESLNRSYLVTNPIETFACVFSFLLLFSGIFALDVYMRKRRVRSI